MSDAPAVVMVALAFLEHCRFLQEVEDETISVPRDLPSSDKKVREEALKVLRVYFKSPKAYNAPAPNPWLPVDGGHVVFVRSEERDERPANQPRLEDRPD